MKKVASIALTATLIISNVHFALAQLGGVTPPAVDLCPNISGTQETIPTGMIVDGSGNCITPIPADTTGPVVSGVASLSVAIHNATIVWITDELAVSTFTYSIDESYALHPTLDATALLAHTAILTGLTAGTTYHYCIRATDLTGNVTNSCGHTFATASQTVVVDTTPPDVTLITVVPITATSAVINFTTGEVGNARVEYGTTAGYGQTTALDTNLALTHIVTLSSLTPNTQYHYRIITSDELGNETITSDETFTTELLGGAVEVGSTDTTAPIISGVGTATLGLTDATIIWQTNELATSTLEYGTTASYGSHATLPIGALLTHTGTLTGLGTNTTYYYCIHATDLAGNTAASCPHSFTTGSQTGVQVPIPDVIISGVDTASIATSTVTITWHTDVPSDSQVEYGDSENFGFLSALGSTLTTSHSVTLTGLTPNTNYIFRVKSKPAGATVATASSNNEFNTLNHSTPVVAPANIISVSSGSVTTTGATITWSTDKAATSLMEYGISSGYGVSTVESMTLTASHSVSLADLEPSTTYHFRVRSADEVSNITFSQDYTFTTPAGVSSGTTGGTTVPAITMSLGAGGHDNTSVELTWQVVSPTADVAAEYDIRYSTSPIYAYNFDGATAAQLTPVYYGDLSANGTERAYIIAGLNPQTTYYFALKSKHENSAYSNISNTVAITTTAGESVNTETGVTSIGPGGHSATGQGGGVSVGGQYGSNSGGTGAGSFEPTMVKAEPADGQIIFEWANPGEANFVRTVVVRKEGSYPTSPTDGQTIYEGRGDTYADIGLTNGTTYYYAIYSYNHAKTYSKSVNVSLAPSGSNKEIKFNESGTLASSTPALHFVRTWKKGDKDIEIEHLQEIFSVDSDAYPEKYITGYFGSLTQAALKRFQAKHGLSQTGVVDTATQKELNTISHSETKLEIPTDYVVFNTDLKYGDQSDAVKDLQQYLIYEGSYAEALVSGYFGAYTKAAVKKFQAKYGVTPVSGLVAYKTRHKMQQLVGL